MNYINKVKPLYIDIFTYLICFSALLLVSWRNPVSYDAFWHLAIGRDILEQGLNYAFNLKDEFSFTLAGQSYHSTYMFDIFTAYLVSLFGISTGFVIIKFIFFSSFLLLLFYLFKKHQVHWKISIITLPFITYFFQFRSTVRPELLSMILIVLALILFYQAKKSFTNKNLIAISLLLLFWVNYHNPVFGYMIFFALFIDKASNKIRGISSFSWRFWAIWGLIIFSIAFINPEFKHFFFNTLAFDPRWKQYISEYKPVLQHFNYPQVYLFLLVSIYLSAFLFIKKQYGSFLIVLMLTFFSWKMARILAPATIINLSILSISINRIDWPAINSKIKGSVFILLHLLWSLLFIFALYSIKLFAQGVIDQNESYKDLFPSNIVQYLKEKNSPGKILNQMTTGGYISYSLGNNYPVYIDGRTNMLYSFNYFENFINIFNSPQSLKTTTDKYQIDYILFQNDPNIFKIADATGDYKVDYLSKNFLLMSRQQPSFPLSGKLLFQPACWKNEFTTLFHTEIAHKNILDSKSPLKYTLDLIKNNNLSYIQELKIEEHLPSQYMRIAAYISAKHQLWKKSAEFFSMISNQEKTMNDWFMMSYFLLKAGYPYDAEQLIHYAIFKKWTLRTIELTRIDRKVILYILLSIQKENKLTLITPNYMKKLKESIKDAMLEIPFNGSLEDFMCRNSLSRYN